MKQSVYVATNKTIPCQSLKDLFLLWESRRADSALPPRHAFRFQDFKPWLGTLIIMKYDQGTGYMAAGLVGTIITEWDKKDLTGKPLDKSTLGKSNKLITAPLHYAIKKKRPTIAIAINEKIGGTFTRLVLPCAGDGITISHLIIALQPDRAFQAYLRTNSLLDAMT